MSVALATYLHPDPGTSGAPRTSKGFSFLTRPLPSDAGGFSEGTAPLCRPRCQCWSSSTNPFHGASRQVMCRSPT